MPTEITSSNRPNGEQLINQIKNIRMGLDGLITEIDGIRLSVADQEELFILLFEAKKKIKEGRMWLGDTLGTLGNVLPPEFADKYDQERKSTDPARE